MSGSIAKRGKAANKWALRFDLEPDPDTGKRRQKIVAFAGTKREADKELARLVTLAGQGQINTAQKLTVAQFLEQWLENEVKPNRASSTYKCRSDHVRCYIIPALGTKPLDKVRTADIVQFLGHLRTTVGVRSKQPLAAGTQKGIYTTFACALRAAVRWKLLATNPSADMITPSSKSKQMQAFSPVEAQAFLAAAARQDIQTHAFFRLAITTGMRLGELRGLHWKDVDLDTRKVLTVCCTAQAQRGKGIQIHAPKTARSTRQIALSIEMIHLLKQHRAAQNQCRLQRGASWHDADLVFTNGSGWFFCEPVIRKRLHRLCAAASLPYIRIHDLRHTAATLMLIGGVHIKVAGERLGNSVQTMLKVYAHVSESMQREAAETLELVFGRA